MKNIVICKSKQILYYFVKKCFIRTYLFYRTKKMKKYIPPAIFGLTTLTKCSNIKIIHKLTGI